MLKLNILNFIKKILLLSLLFFITLNITNAYNYNENYSNLEIEANGWCANMQTNIMVYDQNEYNNRTLIRDNLCIGNETPTKDRCEEFTKISADVIVYNGPLDSLGVLYKGTLDSNSSFTTNFPTENNYLIEILPKSGNYNDYHKLFDARKCNFMSNDLKVNSNITKEITFFNQTFNYPNTLTKLILKNTKIKKSDEIIVRDIDIKLASLPVLENSIKTIEVTSANKDFTSLDISINQYYDPTSKIIVRKYNENTKVWNIIDSFTKDTNTILIKSASYGIYSIVEEKKEKVPEVIVGKLNDTKVENITNSKKEYVPVKNESNSNTLWIVLGSVLLIGFVIFLVLNKKKTNYHDIKTNSTNEPVEILTTYEQELTRTREYIKKYMDNFSRDQIYRALKDANIPRDIIDKVFLELY